MTRGSLSKLAVLLVGVLALLGAGCGGGGDSGGSSDTSGGSAAGSSGTSTGKIGGSVEMIGAFGGDEEKAFNTALKPFEDQTGIDVKYTSTNDLPTLIRSRVNGQNPPDIALFPQPGLANDLAKQGATVPLEDYLDLNALKKTLIPGFLEAATVNGKAYAAPMRMAVKSLLWYPVPEFEKAGYKIPKTHEELLKLEDQMIKDGRTPLCLGYEDGQATGWVGTDWIEEYMLRTGGPEVYDKWVNHQIKFDSPEVKKAFDAYAAVALKDKAVPGGRSAILSTVFGDAPNGMFKSPPTCWLHRQGNFITGFFPKSVQADLAGNVGVAYYPPMASGYKGKPLLGGGDVASLFKKSADDEASIATMKFITSDKFGGPWARAGGSLSPHKTFDKSQYVDDTTRKIADLVTQADVFRFDGSDLMPAVVGAGTFWRGMIDWTGGRKDLDTVLKEIDDSWPQQ